MSKADLLRIADEIPSLRDNGSTSFAFRILDGRRRLPMADESLRRAWADICRAAEALNTPSPSLPATVETYGEWNAEWNRLRQYCLEAAGDFKHSPDYASCKWKDEVYVFTNAQAVVVKHLHDAFKNGTPVLSEAHLCQVASGDSDESECGKRLKDLFKPSGKINPAWGTLIVEVPKGKRKLNI